MVPLLPVQRPVPVVINTRKFITPAAVPFTGAIDLRSRPGTVRHDDAGVTSSPAAGARIPAARPLSPAVRPGLQFITHRA
jgi:hypothetical protein